ncbi:MAG: hypothetical protein IT236_17565, partial [Bacteroidia bacterium]|nr:hypothetical protein [Bacteroidia bacterium]
MKKATGISILFLMAMLMGSAQTIEKQLYLKWQLRQKGTWNWYSKPGAGNVHLDLLENKIIKEPFYADNEKNLQWIENEDWEYKTEFEADDKLLQQTHVQLNFKGLDTYANVYLNDSLILKANNMFREWPVEVKGLIKKNNQLKITFESPIKKYKQEAAKLPYALPEAERSLTRKAQYHYGWDWGPRFVTAGIWKPIYLKAWTDFELKNVHYVITQLDSSIAKLNIIYETVCEKPGTYLAECAYVLQKSALSATWEKTYKTLKLKEGQNYDTLVCLIRNPKWWWCNGMGQATLYAFRCSVSYNGNQQQTKRFNAGLRKLELVQESDP